MASIFGTQKISHTLASPVTVSSYSGFGFVRPDAHNGSLYGRRPLFLPINVSDDLGGLDVCVVGGSVAGLTTARALALQGASVRVFERRPAVADPRGGAIMLRPEGRKIFDDLGVTLNRGVLLDSRLQIQDGFEQFRGAPNSESLTWKGLVESLRTSVSELPNCMTYDTSDVVDIKPSFSAPALNLADGTTISADLMVVADGANSSMMKLLGNQRADKYAGYVAWRGQLPMDAIDDGQRFDMESSLYEHLIPGASFIAFPIRDSDTGQLQLSWTLAHAEDESALPALLGKFADAGLLPPGRASASVVSHIHAAANEMPEHIARIIRAPENLYFGRVIRDLPDQQLPARMAFPGIAVVGDAAYAPRPFSARSSTKAAQDAVDLSLHLVTAFRKTSDRSEALRSALVRYEEVGLQRAIFTAQRTRSLDDQIEVAKAPVPDPLEAGRRTAISELKDFAAGAAEIPLMARGPMTRASFTIETGRNWWGEAIQQREVRALPAAASSTPPEDALAGPNRASPESIAATAATWTFIDFFGANSPLLRQQGWGWGVNVASRQIQEDGVQEVLFPLDEDRSLPVEGRRNVPFIPNRIVASSDVDKDLESFLKRFIVPTTEIAPTVTAEQPSVPDAVEPTRRSRTLGRDLWL